MLVVSTSIIIQVNRKLVCSNFSVCRQNMLPSFVLS